MKDEMSEKQQRYHAVLWINDTPDEYRGNGRFFGDGPYPHGHVYHAESHRPEVAVTFEAMDGTAMRVKFDPLTGAVETEDITAAQR
jgi:hypothetical protein